MARIIAYPKPAVLDRIRHRRLAVIEASAGTGKTFVLEHLILDLVLSGVPIEHLLAVTFTEKATAELRRRIRNKLAAVLAHDDPSLAAGRAADEVWLIDDRARARLGEALAALDRATIATIHGFCQRVLGDHAFAHGHLFEQATVDGRAAFGAAFRTCLRRELTTEPARRAYVEAWLGADQARGLGALEQLLYDAGRAAARVPLGPPFDERRLLEAARALAAIKLGPGAFGIALRGLGKGGSARAAEERLATLLPAAAAVCGTGDVPAFLAHIEGEEKRNRSNGYLTYLVELVRPLDFMKVPGPGPRALREALLTVDAAMVPFAAAVVQALLPPVAARLERDKRSSGAIDFDDMLALVAQGLDGPGGEALAATLRRRFRVALIDEFQDTDELQWKIFRRIFLEGPENGLYLIGDPKQAIYGFRGADVRTYLAARREIEQAGGEVVPLAESFRATADLVDASNAIFSPAGAAAFFTGAVKYDHPVTCGRPERRAVRAGGAPFAPVCLLSIEPPSDGPLRAGPMRQALREAIAAQIRDLLADPPRLDGDAGPRPLAASDIYVLTRTGREGLEVGQALRAARVPHAFYKQEGLFGTAEAEAVYDLLAAIAAPWDRSKRLRAYLTPFFSLSLEELDTLEAAGATAALAERLSAWKAIADALDYDRLFARILDDSGVLRRPLYFDEGERASTNILHIFELLLEEVGRSRRGLEDLVWRLGAWSSGKAAPPGEDSDVQRLETERHAVQILTMHKSKGLEAAAVFLYGGFFRFAGNANVYFHHAHGARQAHVGKPRDPALLADVARERDEEDERMLYVALTRARARLYLPFLGTVTEARGSLEDAFGLADAQEIKRLDGPYALLNARLRSLGGEPDFARFVETVSVPTSSRTPGRVAATATTAVATGASASASERGAGDMPAEALPLLAASGLGAELDALRRRHIGTLVTSYSQLKRLEEASAVTAGEDEVEDEEDEHALDAPAARDDELPAGAATGILLHELLEAVPLDAIAGERAFDAWWSDPQVRAALEPRVAVSPIGPRWARACAEVVHAALTSPLARPGAPPLPPLGALARPPLRELELLYPVPAPIAAAKDAAARPPTFVKGILDVVVEHEGRVYGLDWKSDRVREPRGDSLEAALAQHVSQHYELQMRLYTLGLLRMLGIDDEPAYEARFGGFFYVFLRARPLPRGIVYLRPPYREVRAWSDALPGDPQIARLLA